MSGPTTEAGRAFIYWDHNGAPMPPESFAEAIVTIEAESYVAGHAAGRAAALGGYLDSLRTRLNDTGTSIAHKGAMEYAVQDAYEDATEWVGNPEDGITMTSMAKLADGILDRLLAALDATETKGDGA